MWLQIAAVAVLCMLGLVYRSMKPPAQKLCGTPGGPPVTSKRFKLKDGRHIAYRVAGISLEKAKHKLIVCHGIGSSKDLSLPYSQEFMEEEQVCFVLYDRPGYGESDPNPNRSPKHDAMDIEEVADYLQLGTRFYVIGLSIGSYVVWGCLYYIPHRLCGASLVGPLTSFFWNGIPQKVARESFNKLYFHEQLFIRGAHYTPWLINFLGYLVSPFYKTQKPDSKFTPDDLAILIMFAKDPNQAALEVKAMQQGFYYTLCQDMAANYGKWEFNPLKMEDPFPNGEGSVLLWHGVDDKIVPVELNRCVAKKLKWIKYHELPGKGHMLFHYPQLCETFLQQILMKTECFVCNPQRLENVWC